MESIQETKEAYVKRLWGWVNEQGFDLSLEEIRELHERNVSWFVEQTYVVIINYNCHISPVRHIVEIKEPYNREMFGKWYYEEYHKLEGDEFIFCPSHDHMFACVKAAEKSCRKNNEKPAIGG